MDKLKNLSHIVSKGPDSFEMEEVSAVTSAFFLLEMAHGHRISLFAFLTSSIHLISQLLAFYLMVLS